MEMYVMILVQALAVCLMLTPKQTHVLQDIIPQYSHAILAVAMVESSLDPQARSPVGAKGLMQIMPIALKEVRQRGCKNITLPGKINLMTIEHNLMVGSCYLNILRNHYSLQGKRLWQAYNGGVSRVLRGKTMFKETREYVVKIHNTLKRINQCADKILTSTKLERKHENFEYLGGHRIDLYGASHPVPSRYHRARKM